jgi:hypothetical protein
MATKKSTKKPSRAKGGSGGRRKKQTATGLSPEAQRNIAAIFLAALAVLLLFACFNFGGTLVSWEVWQRCFTLG